MKVKQDVPQLYLRLALSLGFLSAVADRLGWYGPAGSHNVAWGNWANFVAYTHKLLPFFSRPVAGFFGLVATAVEVLFSLMLLAGYKTRFAAMGSCYLTLTFALCMSVFLGVKSPLDYSVFAFSAGSLLLATLPSYRWSLDEALSSGRSEVQG